LSSEHDLIKAWHSYSDHIHSPEETQRILADLSDAAAALGLTHWTDLVNGERMLLDGEHRQAIDEFLKFWKTLDDYDASVRDELSGIVLFRLNWASIGRLNGVPIEDDTEKHVRLSRVIIQTTIDLEELEQYDKALLLYDALIEKYSDCKETRLQKSAAAASINKAIILWHLDKHDESLRILEKIIEQFRESGSEELQESVALALLNKGEILCDLERSEDALAAFEAVITKFQWHTAESFRESVSMALLQKGLILIDSFLIHDALAALDHAIMHCEGKIGTERGNPIFDAMLQKAGLLILLNKYEEAASVCDDILCDTVFSELDGLDERIAHAQFMKAASCVGQDRCEEGMASYDEIIRTYGNHDASQEWVESSCFLKALQASDNYPPDEILTISEDFLTRFDKEDFDEEHIAAVLAIKGKALHNLDRYQEAIEVYEDVITRFGDLASECTQQEVAECLLNKGYALNTLGRHGEAKGAYSEIISRYAESENEELREFVHLAKCALAECGD